MGKPINDSNEVCPLHNKYVRKVCHTCPLYVKITGKNPQSEEIIDRWNCSLAFLPMLLIENAQMSRQTGAAVESFRNETVRRASQLRPVQHAPEGGAYINAKPAQQLISSASGVQQDTE